MTEKKAKRPRKVVDPMIAELRRWLAAIGENCDDPTVCIYVEVVKHDHAHHRQFGEIPDWRRGPVEATPTVTHRIQDPHQVN